MSGVFVLVRYGQSLNNQNEQIDLLLSFGLCQLGGNDPSCPNHDDIVDKVNVVLNCITYFILGLIPLTSMPYAITSSDIEKLRQHLRLTSARLWTARSTSSDSRKKESVQPNPATPAMQGPGIQD